MRLFQDIGIVQLSSLSAQFLQYLHQNQSLALIHFAEQLLQGWLINRQIPIVNGLPTTLDDKSLEDLELFLLAGLNLGEQLVVLFGVFFQKELFGSLEGVCNEALEVVAYLFLAFKI